MTLDLDHLKQVKRIITHETCADGMASAMILKHVYPDITPEFVQYGTKKQEELEATPGMLFCDFSPHKDRVKDFLDAEAIVLDHHFRNKGAIDPFVEAGLGEFGDEKTQPGVCGAVLAYRHVWAPLASERFANFSDIRHVVEDFAKVAGIRDTWQKEDPRWKEACEQGEALRFWPPEELLMNRSLTQNAPYKWAEKIAIGKLLFQDHLDYIDKCVGDAYRFTSKKGTGVVIFQGLRASSDAAEKIDQDANLVVGFAVKMQDGKPVCIYSTRSHTGFDCGTFCEKHGGGGHTAAAGFKWTLEDDDPSPFFLFQRILDRYELFQPSEAT